MYVLIPISFSQVTLFDFRISDLRTCHKKQQKIYIQLSIMLQTSSVSQAG